MAVLMHEVWEEPDENGQLLPSLCLAGPDGDAFRSTLGTQTRLIATFEASSNFDAMTKYYAMYSWGRYVTEHAIDYDPYPDAWRVRQQIKCP